MNDSGVHDATSNWFPNVERQDAGHHSGQIQPSVLFPDASYDFYNPFDKSLVVATTVEVAADVVATAVEVAADAVVITTGSDLASLVGRDGE